jgi:hypothetical protein
MGKGFENEPKGLRRQGRPNVERSQEPVDERGTEKFAIDFQQKLLEHMQLNPDFDITKQEIAESTEEYLTRGRKEGVKVLEDMLEEIQREGFESLEDDPEGITAALGIINAYLELTHDENEDTLDLGKFD